ncbi:XRE family transcriptional regulator [Amycolatopsis sp. FBCC-B4732]|uniref:XRE family transcriptional regulator n=1 Tax=Amycolatopsis sp. FBCC-B4732 TaxID=3079339 RepID=UPI001FF19C8F|nr:XRE family transcriptional regulator [Amycolatopsis sp. FBCC-B4732]UOX93119.1 XRE family transcriptional regulator [Amycolatopsis sp. FBCC-B4732]
MPRAEKPLAPDGSALTEFAAGLRALRENAGNPSYRELARRAHFSATTLSDAAGGRRLPSLAVTLAYVRACDGDAGEWERRWRATAAELTTPAPAEATAPYRGLDAYDREDAGLFFGRDRLVDTLIAAVAAHRCVVVTGPSGAGKTSLLRAGLLPRLSGAVVFTTAGDRLPEGDALVVVDQCEELFAPGRDDDRARFAAALRTGGPRVVLAVRADVADRCAELAGPRETPARVEVGPMTADELRQAITAPAARARCLVETPLLTTAVALAHGRPGALPWLSHALLETWRRRSGTRLTLAGFQAAGEFGGPAAGAAEAVFDALGPPGRAVARDLFRRLADPGEGARAVSADELDDTPLAAGVVERFVRARVLVRDAHRLRPAHETLLGAWPRLAAWLEEDGAERRTHRELTQAAATWRRHDRDPSLLLRGAHLAAVRAWARHPRHLTVHERAYLDASTAAETRPRRRGWLAALLAALCVLSAAAGLGGQPVCGPVALPRADRCPDLCRPAAAAPAPDNAEALDLG